MKNLLLTVGAVVGGIYIVLDIFDRIIEWFSGGNFWGRRD